MHPPVGPAWLVWLETSASAVAMRQWLWLYPIVEIVHIVGFVVLVGAAVLFDLRLLGVSPHLSVTSMAGYLLPWARASLKLTGLVAAGLNVALFHVGTFKSVRVWDHDVVAPMTARIAALVSLILWIGIIACGRLLAYF
jgi:hypothetical protein